MIKIAQGDITRFRRKGGTTAIVNAANVGGLGGGGVDGAIHKAAGGELRDHIESQFPVLFDDVRIPTGDAIVTPAYDIGVDAIIHTTGPIFPTGGARGTRFVGERKLICQRGYDPEMYLRLALTRTLMLAKREFISNLAIPAISCGAFGCPFPTFARALHWTLRQFDLSGMEIVVVLFQDSEVEAFTEAWQAIPRVETAKLAFDDPDPIDVPDTLSEDAVKATQDGAPKEPEDA